MGDKRLSGGRYLAKFPMRFNDPGKKIALCGFAKNAKDEAAVNSGYLATFTGFDWQFGQFGHFRPQV